MMEAKAAGMDRLCFSKLGDLYDGVKKPHECRQIVLLQNGRSSNFWIDNWDFINCRRTVVKNSLQWIIPVSTKLIIQLQNPNGNSASF
jgi:hypothetical protein